jgi:K+-transporting ATPase ATPase C chain
VKNARQYLTSLRLLLGITVILGILYPLVIFGIGQIAIKDSANGSFVKLDKKVVGSRLIGQNFPGSSWFHSRPSAAGATGYDALSSGASNAGPNESGLSQTLKARQKAIMAEEGIAANEVPADAITSSGSGLDPDISPSYARLQVARISQVRHLSISSLNALINRHTTTQTFGFLGEERVNVLELNLALTSLH